MREKVTNTKLLKGLPKRILSLTLAFAMVLTTVLSLSFNSNAANPTSGYTTDANGLMEYRDKGSSVYDFKGFINGSWRMTTYSDGGFKIGAYNGSGLKITTGTPEFIANGKAIKVTYKVKNTSVSPVSDYRFYIAADTKIDGNDASTNSIHNGVVTMTNPNTGNSFFALSTTEGGTAVATEYGSSAVSYTSVIRGADPSTVTPVDSASDSAFVMYFPETDIAVGAEQEYTLVVGMGDASSIDDIIEKVKKALTTSVDYVNEKFTDLEAGGKYWVTKVDGVDTDYQFNSISGTTIPLHGTDSLGHDYDFIGKTIVMVHKGDGGTTSHDSEPVTIQVAPRPVATVPTAPTKSVTADTAAINDIITTNNSIKIKAVPGQAYRIAGSEWKSADSDGFVTFTVVSGSTNTIYTKVKATSEAPESLESAGVLVDAKEMFSPTKVEFHGQYDGEFHELKVNPNVSGATVTYSESPDGTYRSEPYSYKDFGQYKVYYKITKDGYYPAEGVLTATIVRNLKAAKDAAKDIIDREVGGDTSENVIEAANAAKAAIDSATSDEAVIAQIDPGVAAIRAAKAANALDAEKDAAIAVITAEAAPLDTVPDNVRNAALGAIGKIMAATSSQGVATETNIGIENIRAAKAENALKLEKDAAKAVIDEEVNQDTSTNVVEAATAAKAAIDAATSSEDVALETAKGIEAIRAAKEANALQAAKDKAIADLLEEIEGSYESAPQEVKDAFDAAKAAVNGAPDLENVIKETIKGLVNIEKAKGKAEEAAKAAALLAAKNAAKDIIDAEVGSHPWEAVQNAADTAKTLIDQATSLEDVESATDTGIENIRRLKAEHDMLEAKKAANDIIDNEVAGDTSHNVEAAASQAKAIINAMTHPAKNPEDVALAVAEGVKKIQEAKRANELVAAKQNALELIQHEIAGDTSENVRQAAEAVIAKINAASLAEDVVEETTLGIEAILAAKEANALQAAKEVAKADIDRECVGFTSESVRQAAEAAKAAIDAATTMTNVAIETARGIELIDAAKVTSLAKAKEDAFAAIIAEVAGDTASNVKKAAAAAKKAIEEATDMDAVEAAKINGINAIRAAKAANKPDVDVKGDVAPAKPNQIVNITPSILHNDFSAVLDSTNLEKAIVRTDIEKSSGIWTWIEVEDVTHSIHPDERLIIASNVNGATIGAFIDIDLYKQISGQKKVQITETAEPIVITLDVPIGLVAPGRSFAIVRVHNGVFEQITDFATLGSNNTITFASDKFSTYAIIYKDAQPDSQSDSQANSKVKSPKTGDTTSPLLYLVLILSGSLAGIVLLRRREK